MRSSSSEVLAIALEALDPGEAEAVLLAGVSGMEQELADAAFLLGLGWAPELQPLLVTLIGDRSSWVRSTPAHAVGRLLASDPNQQLITMAQAAVSNQSFLVPQSLLTGLADAGPPLPERALSLVRPLLRHPSARVRRKANRTTGESHS